MPLELISLLDTSHFATFLGGACIGAAGTYLADRFTDQRRNSEARSRNLKQFRRIEKHMPDLFSEFRKDLAERPELAIREFVLLPSQNVIFNHGQPRFVYFESDYLALKNLVSLLVQAGYVSIVRSTDTPIYQLNEHFVELLQIARVPIGVQAQG